MKELYSTVNNTYKYAEKLEQLLNDVATGKARKVNLVPSIYEDVSVLQFKNRDYIVCTDNKGCTNFIPNENLIYIGEVDRQVYDIKKEEVSKDDYNQLVELYKEYKKEEEWVLSTY